MRLRRLFGLEAQAPPDEGRWIVIDVESSGLDARRDRLLAIAGVALHHDGPRPRLQCADSFEVLLRQPEAPLDKPNVLLHGIGVGAQRTGVAAPQALADFEAWVGSSPLIGFNVAFDQALIQRAMAANLQRRLAVEWLDLATLAAVVQPAARARSLDDWLERFGIDCATRHQAAADAVATAELLLALWPSIQRQRPAAGFRGLVRLGDQQRWLGTNLHPQP
jgi:DNA polymerase-3 subunit epsilon